jgi:hypothetical protein
LKSTARLARTLPKQMSAEKGAHRHDDAREWQHQFSERDGLRVSRRNNAHQNQRHE